MSNDLTSLVNKLLCATGIALLLTCDLAVAGGFQLHEQSVTYLGNAYSGTASTAEDASTNYYNPAGLPELKNSQLVLSGIYAYGDIKLYNASAVNNVGTPVVANSSCHAASNAFIPGLHMNANLNKKWSVGFSVVAPFGLSSKYSSTSIARYRSTKSSILTVDLTPSIAYKINDKFSVGAGFDAMYIRAVLDVDIHFATEGFVNSTAHAWTYGYHVGGMFKPSCATRMGLVYFSSFNPTLRGTDSTLGFPTAPAPTTLRAQLPLPDRVVYSITHDYSNTWTALADVEWVHWSKLKVLFVQYNQGTVQYQPLDNKNTWRVALGANYKYSNSLMFKGGLAFDESPVTTPYRIAAEPDSNRYWIAIGVKYKFLKYLAIDAGYTHLFFNKSSIQQLGFVGTSMRETLFGNYKNSADLVGVQLTWNFV